MSINRGRAIYDETDADFDTNYRTKLCSKWIAQHKVKSAILHSPIVEKSHATLTAHNLHAQNRMTQNLDKMKSTTKKSEHKQFGKNAEKDAVDDYDFYRPFFDDKDGSKAAKNKEYMLKPTSMHRKTSTQNGHEKSYQRSQAHSTEKRHSEKRSRVSDDEKLDFGDFVDDQFEFDFSSDKYRPPVSQGHSKKQKIDKDYDFSVDFIDVENVFNEKRNDSGLNCRANEMHTERHEKPKPAADSYGKYQSKQLILKRVKERNYEELLQSPHVATQNELSVELFKQYNTKSERKHDKRHEKPHKTSSDPMERAIVGYKTHHHKSKHDGGKDQYLKQVDEIDFPAFNQAKKAIKALKAISSRTTNQPIIFNIKCNNLIMKTD